MPERNLASSSVTFAPLSAASHELREPDIIEPHERRRSGSDAMVVRSRMTPMAVISLSTRHGGLIARAEQFNQRAHASLHSVVPCHDEFRSKPISVMEDLKASVLAIADFRRGGPAMNAMRVCRSAAKCWTAGECRSVVNPNVDYAGSIGPDVDEHQRHFSEAKMAEQGFLHTER